MSQAGPTVRESVFSVAIPIVDWKERVGSSAHADPVVVLASFVFVRLIIRFMKLTPLERWVPSRRCGPIVLLVAFPDPPGSGAPLWSKTLKPSPIQPFCLVLKLEGLSSAPRYGRHGKYASEPNDCIATATTHEGDYNKSQMPSCLWIQRSESVKRREYECPS